MTWVCRTPFLAAVAASFVGASPALAQVLRAGPLLNDVRSLGASAEYVLEAEGIDRLVTDASTLELVLPDGVFVARRVRAETQADGFYWQGRLHESWPVMITAHRGAISGLIHTPWAQYELVPAGGTTASVPRLAKLEAELFPPCATDAADGSALLSGPPAHRSSTTALAGSAPIILDVLVVYTAQARAGAGGQAQIEATILSAVNVTNTAYANSDVDARLHLMHMAEAPFGDSGSSSTDLSSVRTSTVVQAWRDRFGADLVALIVNGNDACGRGYLQRVPGPGFASLAYQVTTRGCAVGNLSFAHEFGHNQGCEHDPANANPPNRASFPYAYGHFHSGVYRTVMSYSNQCRGGCGRAPYFSNSNVIHEGLDTGIFDARENYRVINQTAGIVAAFRSSASTADFAQSSWTIAEDRGAIDIDVERGGLTDGPATIFVRPREDSARAGADFPVFTTTVTWAAGDASAKRVRIPILDDRALEGQERFELVFEEGRGVGGGPSAEIIIEDVEEGYVRLVPPAAPALENQNVVSVRVERFDGRDGAGTVEWSLSNGSARAGEDFEAGSGTLTWADDDARTQLITIPLLDDVNVEGTESFTLALSNPTGGLIVSTPSLSIDIEDYEEGAFAFAVTSTVVREDSGLIFLDVVREGGSDGSSAVTLALDTPNSGSASATEGQDFAIRLPTFVVPEGVSRWPVPLEILDDAMIEGQEAFAVRLASASNGARIVSPEAMTVTLMDWEEGRAGLLEDALSVDEDAGEVQLTVARTGGTDGPAVVHYATVSASARAALDFVPTEAEVRWESGEGGPKAVAIPLLDDDIEEGDETFLVRLDRFLGLGRGEQTEVQVTLRDREAGELGFASEAIRVRETDGGQITVDRSGGSDGEVSVRWRIRGGSAAVPSDVSAAEGTLSFPDGDRSPRNISLNVSDDRAREDEESFFVELSNPTGGARLGTATATVAVVDAGAGDVSYMGRSTVLESAADFTLTFERSGEAYGPLTLSYRVVGGTAQADTDVADSAGTVGWDADETGTREARIALVDDNEDEPDETLVFRFEVSDPTAVLSVAEATVTVLDDDDGCACSSVHKGRRGSVWAVFLVLGLLFARRRNR